MEQDNGCTALRSPFPRLSSAAGGEQLVTHRTALRKVPSWAQGQRQSAGCLPPAQLTRQAACGPSPWGTPHPCRIVTAPCGDRDAMQVLQAACRQCQTPSLLPTDTALPSPQHPLPALPDPPLHARHGDVSLPCPCGRSSCSLRCSGERRTEQSCLQTACREEEKAGRLAASQQIRLQQQSLRPAGSCSTKASPESA